jgi:hypothetical protein
MSKAKQEFQALDTTVVQVRSVLNFMYTLGYTLDADSKTGRFFTNVKEMQGNRFLSFATAAILHNLSEESWLVNPENGEAHPTCLIKLRHGFSGLGVRLAMASKLVKKVKLSVAKGGAVITQDIMIKPLNNAVLRLVEPL